VTRTQTSPFPSQMYKAMSPAILPISGQNRRNTLPFCYSGSPFPPPPCAVTEQLPLRPSTHKLHRASAPALNDKLRSGFGSGVIPALPCQGDQDVSQLPIIFVADPHGHLAPRRRGFGKFYTYVRCVLSDPRTPPKCQASKEQGLVALQLDDSSRRRGRKLLF